MIIRAAEIYKRTAEKNELSIDLITSVGEAVFGELLCLMNDPKDLAYELDHIGTFVLRHKSALRRISSARYFKDETFIERYGHIEGMIEDFKQKKTAFKQSKDEYKQKKALQQS